MAGKSYGFASGDEKGLNSDSFSHRPRGSSPGPAVEGFEWKKERSKLHQVVRKCCNVSKEGPFSNPPCSPVLLAL